MMQSKDAMSLNQKVYPEIDAFEMEFLNAVDLTEFQGELYD